MPCYSPLQAFYAYDASGERHVKFSNSAAEAFKNGVKLIGQDLDTFALPCGSCIGCRLERSRQWAVRCMLEASMYEKNCFLTLTYAPENLPKNGSLVKEDFVLFMKKLRRKYVPKMQEGLSQVQKEAWSLKNGIRVFYCGEYGEDFGRPHFHACLFNYDFPDYRTVRGVTERDKEFYKMCNDNKLYVSKSLNEIWGKGIATIGSLTFESAAYVARYCTKVINGKDAQEHYKGKVPEFGHMSNRPGIAAGWFDKFKSDVFPSDYLVIGGVKLKPPRYFDNRFKDDYPIDFEVIKQARVERASANDEDNSYSRLIVREACTQARVKQLFRPLEV